MSKMREQIAEITFAWLCRPQEERIVYELIDEISKAQREEIEKVENPYSASEVVVLETLRVAFEDCRQAILKALEAE